MFAHVIAGIDGTDGGLDAVALARLRGAQRLTLVGAYPGDPLPGWDGPAVDDEPVRDAVLDDLEEAPLAPGITTRRWPAADPSPARALQHVAAVTRADVICVGSSRHGALARILLGDVGRSLLDGAPCSVAVAPRGYAELGVAPRRVAVGYTGTPESDKALERAADWALDHGAHLSVEIAWEVPHRILALGRSPGYAEAYHRAAQWAMGRALDAAPAATVDVTAGSATDVLLDAARRCDLLVLGSRQWGAPGTVCSGSTTSHLLQHAAGPVLVVPRPGANVIAPPAPAAKTITDLTVR